MKNVTLSIPENLLLKSREYAQMHGTNLNSLIRKLLNNTVKKEEGIGLRSLFKQMDAQSN
ncbi:MAG: hypothetical protein L3J06_06205 [Cyclobacteriaceae bacterium]|nr:hypothetical protein [Cyclobacteriaceae bacterium]